MLDETRLIALLLGRNDKLHHDSRRLLRSNSNFQQTRKPAKPRKSTSRRALIVALLLGLADISPALADDITGVASVIDGDTIEIHGQRIRLHGIDAPESSQLCVRPTGERCRCGQQASFALADRIERATVSCEPRDRDRYGRTVAVCFKGNEDLNRWMVANGWTVAYRRYSVDYIADEDAARRSRVNMWSGEFDMPWDGRAQRRNN